MTVWWWVRHGPTHQTVLTGWRDVPADLSDAAAIARLDAALPRPALLVSSDLIRAVATADVLGAGRTRLPHATALREAALGDWDGLHYSEVAARDPDLSRRYWEAPGDAAPPGGESWNQLAARVGGFVAKTSAAFPDADIVAVAHAGVILTEVRAATGRTASEVLAQPVEPLSLTRIVRGPPADLLQINRRP